MAARVDPTAWTDRWTDSLRRAGLRVTQQRLAILQVLDAEPHIAADQVAERVRTAFGAMSTQAVYDTLNTLTEHRILRRFEPAGSSMRFEISTGDNHHHLVCRQCGKVVDVACSVDAIPCAMPDDTRGFVIDEAEVTYWGVCADCARHQGMVSRPTDTSSSTGP